MAGKARRKPNKSKDESKRDELDLGEDTSKEKSGSKDTLQDSDEESARVKRKRRSRSKATDLKESTTEKDTEATEKEDTKERGNAKDKKKDKDKEKNKDKDSRKDKGTRQTGAKSKKEKKSKEEGRRAAAAAAAVRATLSGARDEGNDVVTAIKKKPAELSVEDAFEVRSGQRSGEKRKKGVKLAIGAAGEGQSVLAKLKAKQAEEDEKKAVEDEEGDGNDCDDAAAKQAEEDEKKAVEDEEGDGNDCDDAAAESHDESSGPRRKERRRLVKSRSRDEPAADKARKGCEDQPHWSESNIKPLSGPGHVTLPALQRRQRNVAVACISTKIF